MPATEEDLSFLSFFLTEPVYLLPETEPMPVSIPKNAPAQEAVTEPEPQLPEKNEKDSEDFTRPNESSLAPPATRGQNTKGVLILYHKPGAEELEPDTAALLTKILKAVNHDIEDVARCNWALLEQQVEAQSNIFESLQLIDCQKIIAFGDLPLAWSMSHFFQRYHITEDASGNRLLLADDLHEVAQNRDLKIKLWESLQKMFK